MDIYKRLLVESDREVTGEHSIIPMINVVFLILIFFMISGSFEKPDTEGVELPISDSDHPLQQQEVIKLSPSGSLKWRDQEFLISEMQGLLKKRGWHVPARIIVVTSYDIQSSHVIDLIEELRNFGAESLSLVTTTEHSYAAPQN